MQLNELCKEAHARAIAGGWWEPGKEKRPLECHMLICSEIAEATEEVRNSRPPFYVAGHGSNRAMEPTAYKVEDGKPEGETVEMADAIIRIADWFGRNGWDMEAVVKAKMEYNATRSYRHGGKSA